MWTPTALWGGELVSVHSGKSADVAFCTEMHKKAAATMSFFLRSRQTRQTNGCPKTTFHPVTHWSESRSAWQTGASSSQLFVLLCSLSDVSIHKTKKTSLLRSSAFVHQLSEGPVLLNYSSCIVVFLTETVKVTLLSPTVLKALHVPCDDSCRRRELWRHSSQLGSKSRDVDV